MTNIIKLKPKNRTKKWLYTINMQVYNTVTADSKEQVENDIMTILKQFKGALKNIDIVSLFVEAA